MLYVVDTTPWSETDVQRECVVHDVEFKGGEYFPATCVKLASKILKNHVADEFDLGDTLKLTNRGKPYFEDVPVHFNISHHNRIVIAVVSQTAEVGIDITDATTPFDEKELGELFSMPPTQAMAGVYWAAREAYLKYTGEGSRETPLEVRKPAYSAIPELQTLSNLSVMPFMKVERSYVRLFRLGDLVGAVVAPREDVVDVSFFSSDAPDLDSQGSESSTPVLPDASKEILAE